MNDGLPGASVNVLGNSVGERSWVIPVFLVTFLDMNLVNNGFAFLGDFIHELGYRVGIKTFFRIIGNNPYK